MNYAIFQQNTVSGIKRPDWDVMDTCEVIESEAQAQSICNALNMHRVEYNALHQCNSVYGTMDELWAWQNGYETIGGQEYEDPEYHVYIKNMTTGAIKECTGDDPRVQPCFSAKKVAERVESLNKEFAEQLATKNCKYIYHEPMIAVY